jgi:pimeloyl-ACP methyl ester carboxylesterase
MRASGVGEHQPLDTGAASGTRPITLDAGGIPLSGLVAEARPGPPRAVVVAVHGGGMRAGYFDSRARPGLSLLTLGAELGYTVLAVDRPGYGSSAPWLPRGQTLAEQAATLHDGLASFATTHGTGAGLFLVAHSNGGKLALAAAAEERGRTLLGLDISGLGSRLAVRTDQLPGQNGHGDWRRHWGSLRLYPPDAFRQGRHLVSPVPELEAHEGPLWPRMYPDIARRVRIPVRFTFAEQEQWWLFDDDAVAALRQPLAAPKAVVAHQPDAGHNLSLGWAARAYHLKALSFLEDCLLAQDAAPTQRRARPLSQTPTPA